MLVDKNAFQGNSGVSSNPAGKADLLSLVSAK